MATGAGYTYNYDAEGNRTVRFVDNGSTPGELDSADTDVTRYTWDNRNRLEQVTHYADGNPATASDKIGGIRGTRTDIGILGKIL